MDNLKKENYLQILFFISIIVLIIAYVVQYIFNYQPCNLCLLERIPYGVTIIILVLNYIFRQDQLFYSILLILTFLFSLLLSVYHFGIEQGIIEETAVCASKNLDLITKEDILNSLQELRISCKDVAFKIFGLSLTTYNILISLFMLVLSIKIYLLNYDIKK